MSLSDGVRPLRQRVFVMLSKGGEPRLWGLKSPKGTLVSCAPQGIFVDAAVRFLRLKPYASTLNSSALGRTDRARH
jgi:hypothetical protein